MKFTESDGRMQMLTPMDPLLLAIPYLRAAERSVPLDHLLVDDDYSEIGDIIGILTREKLEKIATSKGPADLNVWKWDEDKCLDYLATKVKKLNKKIPRVINYPLFQLLFLLEDFIINSPNYDQHC